MPRASTLSWEKKIKKSNSNFFWLFWVLIWFNWVNFSLGIGCAQGALHALCGDYLKVGSLQAGFMILSPFHSVFWPIRGGWQPALLSAHSLKTPGSTETGNGNSIALLFLPLSLSPFLSLWMNKKEKKQMCNNICVEKGT